MFIRKNRKNHKKTKLSGYRHYLTPSIILSIIALIFAITGFIIQVSLSNNVNHYASREKSIEKHAISAKDNSETDTQSDHDFTFDDSDSNSSQSQALVSFDDKDFWTVMGKSANDDETLYQDSTTSGFAFFAKDRSPLSKTILKFDNGYKLFINNKTYVVTKRTNYTNDEDTLYDFSRVGVSQAKFFVRDADLHPVVITAELQK